MKLQNFWLLAAASAPPAHVDVAAIHAVLEQQKLGGDGFAAALDELQQRPVVVETLDEQRRVFSLPPGAITLRELTFGTAGLGYSVWDAGVGMSLWLSQHAEAVRGKRVLELGSGVGIAGIAAALCGGAHVTLSDYGFAADGGGAEADARAELLRSNLEENARRSGVSERCDAVALDWHASLRQGSCKISAKFWRSRPLRPTNGSSTAPRATRRRPPPRRRGGRRPAAPSPRVRRGGSASTPRPARARRRREP